MHKRLGLNLETPKENDNNWYQKRKKKCHNLPKKTQSSLMFARMEGRFGRSTEGGHFETKKEKHFSYNLLNDPLILPCVSNFGCNMLWILGFSRCRCDSGPPIYGEVKRETHLDGCRPRIKKLIGGQIWICGKVNKKENTYNLTILDCTVIF